MINHKTKQYSYYSLWLTPQKKLDYSSVYKYFQSSTPYGDVAFWGAAAYIEIASKNVNLSS